MKIIIAKITSPHGIKGEVKLLNYSENPKDLEKYNPIFTKDGKNYKIKLVRNIKQNIYIAKINNINNRNQAEEIRNTELFIDTKQLKELPENEFYHQDLIGLTVKNTKGENVGIVNNIMNFGAEDLFEINFTDHQYNKSFNILPFNKEVIKEVNLKENYLIFDNFDID